MFAREEYHSAIRSLGSSKTLLQGLSQPQFSSTPAVSSSSKSALVPEEEYLADDWLEDDLGEVQPKKKRRLRVEQNGMMGDDASTFSAAWSQNRKSNTDTTHKGCQSFYYYYFLAFIIFFSSLYLCLFSHHYALLTSSQLLQFPRPPAGRSL